METAPGETNNRKKYLIFGGLSIFAIAMIAFVTWALLKAYAPVKTVDSTQDSSQSQNKALQTPTMPVAAPIVPTATTSTEVDSLQTLLQTDSANDAAVDNALNDNKQQIIVPTE